MKGSDFWIDAEIKHFNPTAMFRPVNHSDAMDKGDYPGSPDVVENYCPYPVPSYYQLFYTVHQVSFILCRALLLSGSSISHLNTWSQLCRFKSHTSHMLEWQMSQLMRLWYLSHRRPAKAEASLRIRAVLPEPLLFAHIKYGSSWRVWPKIRHLAPLDGWACAFEEWVYGGWKVP